MRPLCLAPVLAACASGRAAPPPPPPPDPVEAPAPGTGYVLVRMDAWLRSAPSFDAPGARAGMKEEGCHADFGELVWSMRLVADRGEWLEVENLSAAEASIHCYDHRLDGLDGLRLRMHVRRADLMPVTRREVSVDFDDGTGFTLAAGVNVGGGRVSVDHNQVALPLPLDAVGMSYPTPTRRLRHADDEETRSMIDGELRLGGDEVDLNLFDATVERDGATATFAYACSEYRTSFTELGGGTGWGTIGCGEYGTLGVTGLPRIRVGATLTWPDGSHAGETLGELQVRWPADELDGRRCFRRPLRHRNDWPDRDRPRDEWFVAVCAADDDWISGSDPG